VASLVTSTAELGSCTGLAAGCIGTRGLEGGSGPSGGRFGSGSGDAVADPEKGGAASGARGGGADTPPGEGGRGGGLGTGREGNGFGATPPSASGSASSSSSSIGVAPPGFFRGGRGVGRKLPAFEGEFGELPRILGGAGRRLFASGGPPSVVG
jgi:hypothetical protein